MPAGSQLLVRGLLLRNAMLPSKQLVDSGLAAPAPLAFNLSTSSSGSGGSIGNTSLVLDNCTLSTSCDNLAQFGSWLAGVPHVQVSPLSHIAHSGHSDNNPQFQ